MSSRTSNNLTHNPSANQAQNQSGPSDFSKKVQTLKKVLLVLFFLTMFVYLAIGVCLKIKEFVKIILKRTLKEEL